MESNGKPETGSDPLKKPGTADQNGEDKDEVKINAALPPKNSVMRTTVAALQRSAALNSDEAIRKAALLSLENVVLSHPLLVIQCWLDLYNSVTSKSHPNFDLINLLKCLETIVDKVVDHNLIDNENSAHKAVLGKVIGLCTEEMTKSLDVLPDIQKPSSQVLVRFGEKHVERVMDFVLLKFQPGMQPHFYVISTLSSIAMTNSTGTVPFLKAILGTMLSSMKSVKKDNLRYGFATAYSKFAEAILDYLANIENTPDPTVTKEHFVKEIDGAHEILFSSWLPSTKDVKVRHGIMEALGQMGALLSDERLYKNSTQILNVLINQYKRSSEQYYVTLCISQLLDAIVNKDPQILEVVIEPLLTALFTQVCQPTDYEKPFTVRNHNEVLRCYDVLIKSHGEKLINGLILRMGSIDENIRLGALTVFKHLMNSSLEQLKERMPDIFNSLHSKLNDNSNKVRKMLAQLTALLGRLGYLEGGKGRDFLEFIVKLCALPPDDRMQSVTDQDFVSNSSLVSMCDNILHLLTNSVDAMQPVLWPHLLEYLLAPDYSAAIPSVVKSLSLMASKKRQSSTPDYLIDYADFQYIPGPYVLFARLIVLSALPFTGNRGGPILSFLQHFAPNISRHLANLWDQRIPLLQHYLETHTQQPGQHQQQQQQPGQQSVAVAAAKTWDQEQWEEWLLALLDDTLTEIDLDEWTTALSGAMCQQLALYGSEQIKEKCFLIRSLGHVMKKSGNRSLIQDHLSCVFLSTNHSDFEQQSACAKSFGKCSSKHLDLVLDKLESLLKAEVQKKSASFLGTFLRGNKIDEDHIKTRCTILKCIGKAALNAEIKDLESKVDIITQKFIMPSVQSNQICLKESALMAMSELARSINPNKCNREIQLAHHGDLIHESIECMKRDMSEFPNKQIALSTTMELIKLPPFISQMTRCTLLKACFSSVFPAVLSEHLEKVEDYELAAKTEGNFKDVMNTLVNLIQELLKQELEQSTLDEIFTLLEKHLTWEEALSREMALTLLSSALETFAGNVTFKVGCPSAFTPGPYIIGSIVPRCFDPSKSVQTAGLNCLELLLRILSMYEGHGEESINEMVKKLKSISSMKEEEMKPSSVSIARTVSDILCEKILHDQLLPLLHSLIDNLNDKNASSSKGTSLIMCRLLEARGAEIFSNAPTFIDKLHQKLQVIECEETRVRILLAVRILASQNTRGVVTNLLKYSLPHDEALESIWKVLTHDTELASSCMQLLLESLSANGPVYSEDTDRISGNIIRQAKHLPLSAILALGYMFQMREMEKICEHEFAKIFVPLLSAMGCYIGIKSVEIVKANNSTASTSSSPEKSFFERSQSRKSFSTIVPYTIASNTLQAFLTCKGCNSVAVVLGTQAEDLSSLLSNNVNNKKPFSMTVEQELAEQKQELPSKFAQLVYRLVESIISDTPQYLSKLLSAFQSLHVNYGEGQRIASTAFHTQMIQSEQQTRDPKLIESAIEYLLSSLQDELQCIKIISLNGLAAYKPVSEYEYNLEKHVPSILSAFIQGIDDLSSKEVNYFALTGLAKVIKYIPEEHAHKILTNLSDKVRPYFDCGNSNQSAAAMILFAELARFATGQYKEIFLELVHSVLVSLLIHLEDDVKDIATASRKSISKIFNAIDDEALNGVKAQYLTNDTDNDNDDDADNVSKTSLSNDTSNGSAFQYSLFLRDLSKCSVLMDMFPIYIQTCLSYFRCSSPKLRCNAILVLTSLILSLNDEDLVAEINSETICQAFTQLLTEGNKKVAVVAAENMGKVFTQLYPNAK